MWCVECGVLGVVCWVWCVGCVVLGVVCWVCCIRHICTAVCVFITYCFLPLPTLPRLAVSTVTASPTPYHHPPSPHAITCQFRTYTWKISIESCMCIQRCFSYLYSSCDACVGRPLQTIHVCVSVCVWESVKLSVLVTCL